MKDLTTYYALAENIEKEDIHSILYFNRSNIEGGNPGSVAAIAFILFQTMTSLEELIIITGVGKAVLIVKGNSSLQELEQGTQAVNYTRPLGVCITGHAFSDDDFEEIKMISNDHFIT